MLRKRRLKEKGMVQVTFGLPEEAGGDVVHLVGEFTDWQGTPMKRQEDGSWRATVELKPGRRYQFRYLVDGERWENDWDADDYVANPFGHDNSVVETPDLDSGNGGSRKAGSKKAAGATKSRGAKRTGARGTGRKGAGEKDATARDDNDAGRKKAGTPARKSGRKADSSTKRGASGARGKREEPDE